jgi:hypothetical protein
MQFNNIFSKFIFSKLLKIYSLYIMSFIWTNSSKSGLCDRLIDLFIIASTSKLYNKELYLHWEEQPINDIQRNIWNKIRFDDYKIENVIQYFNFPDIIHFISKDELNKISNYQENNIIFNNYLGGIYSPITFYEKFINKTYTLDTYLDIFKIMINKFKPTDKLLNLVKNINENITSIHLRRTDKSSIYVSPEDAHGVPLNEIDILNNNTKTIINQIINNGYNNLYFSSDCPSTKLEYENYYKDYNILNFNINNSIEQTYIDIYIMSISKYTIMSQKHSSFSLFSSLINESNLIYLYNNDILHNNKYYIFKNIVYYKDFIT